MRSALDLDTVCKGKEKKMPIMVAVPRCRLASIKER